MSNCIKVKKIRRPRKRQDGRRRPVEKRQDGDGRRRPVEKVSGRRRPVENVSLVDVSVLTFSSRPKNQSKLIMREVRGREIKKSRRERERDQIKTKKKS